MFVLFEKEYMNGIGLLFFVILMSFTKEKDFYCCDSECKVNIAPYI